MDKRDVRIFFRGEDSLGFSIVVDRACDKGKVGLVMYFFRVIIVLKNYIVVMLFSCKNLVYLFT